MSDTLPPIRKRVARERLESLYRSTPTNVLATLVVAGAYVTIMSDAMPSSPLYVWYGILSLVMGLRFANYLSFQRKFSPNENTRQWWVRYRLGVAATGILLGCTALFNFYSIPVEHQIFGVFVLAGLAAGALSVMILDQLAFLLYLIGLMIPTALAFLSASLFLDIQGTLHLAISILIFVYVGVLLRASGTLHKMVIDAMILGHENSRLAEKLRKEKERLDSRLGRILNDSSNEIFVVHARTFRCLQVNQGALQHLGFSEEEITSKDLTDIICDLPREELEQLLRPLYAGTEESVFYHGYHQRRDGSRYPVEIRFQHSALETPPVVVATALDMTERDKVKRKLIHQANFDQLTDLPNRSSMLGRIEHAFFQARRNKTRVALLFMDLDDFKKVNDARGHAAGDMLLRQAAERIRSTLRASDTPSRLGGDEFLVMLEGIQERAQARRVAEKLVHAFQKPFQLGGCDIYTSVSIGISIFPDDGVSVEELMQFADIAMYHAKQEKGGHYHCFDQSMIVALEERLEMEGALRRAIANEELSLYYQPKVDAVSGRILGAEALLRWTSDRFGPVPPDRFITLAERLGIMSEIGDWVLREACREAVSWHQALLHPIHVAVNVSPSQFRGSKLVEDVAHALADSGLSPDLLELEITESLLLQDNTEALETLRSLRAKGIHLSLDDFGTGYSSLSYLKRFPLQVLKIDRSFIHDMNHDDNARSLVDAIISMARSLELEIVAEGVETPEQLAFLQQRGVRMIQGYYFSPPVDAAGFRALLERCASQHSSFHAECDRVAKVS